jgi:DNA primase
VSIFEANRGQIDLAQLASQHIDLRRSGDKLLGRCPFEDHEDFTASFYVYRDDHYHCFGCSRHGDVTDLWAALRGLEPGVEAALDLAREYRVEVPDMDPEVRRRAQERREREGEYARQAAVCHGALSRHASVVDWWEKRGFGEGLRERFLLGTNRDSSAAVVPFWHRGRVHGLIRRRLDGEPKYVYPEVSDFPAGYRPLFVPAPLAGDVFLVEGILDALALAALGRGAVAIGGTGISREQRRELEKIPGPLYMLPDADESGIVAARKWVRELYPRARLCPAEYERGIKDA